MSAVETKVLDNLVLAGLGLEDLKLTDELLRDYELAPPLDTEGIVKGRIKVLGAKTVLSSFQVPKTISSGGEDQADMVNLNIIMPKWSRARSVPMPSAALSSSLRSERSGQQSLELRPQQKQQVLALIF